MATQAIPHQWRLFVRSLRVFKNLPAGFGLKSAGGSFGGGPGGFPKSANSLKILKLMIFQETFLTK